MNQPGFLRACGRHWWIIVAAATVGLGVGAIVTVLTPASYSSAVTFFVKTPSAEISSAFQGDQFGQRRVKSYVQLLESERVAQLVADDLGSGLSAATVKSEIVAQTDPNTVLVTATVTDPSASRSLAITQSLATEFVDFVSSLETPAGRSAPTVNLEVTTAPTLDPVPVSPRPLINCGLALLAGLVLGLILVAARDRTDSSVRSVESLRQATGLPVLGAIPFDAAAGQRAVTSAATQSHALEESFRQFRASLVMLPDGPASTRVSQAERDNSCGAYVLTVTSALPEEGRTLMAVRLASGFANAGWEVLLVDGDLRRPRVADCFGLPGMIGLSDVLARRVTFTEAVESRVEPRLSVLTSGPTPASSVDLFQGGPIGDFITSVRRDFQLIVIDTPALLAAADGSVLAAQANAAIHVVRHGRTGLSQVARGLALLDSMGAQVLGCVVNMVPSKGLDGYGFDYGHYHEMGAPPNAAGASEVARDAHTLETVDGATKAS